jgi:hypothetical protein
MREVLEALEWVRREMMHHGSPDFIRQRELEGRVQRLAARLARSGSRAPVTGSLGNQLQARTSTRNKRTVGN